MVKKVLKVDRHIQVVSLFRRGSGTAPLWPCSNRRDSRWTSTSSRRRSWRRGPCLRRNRVALVDDAERKRTTHAHVNYKRSRSLAKVSRNHRLARQRHEIEVAEARAPDRRERAVCIWTSESRRSLTCRSRLKTCLVMRLNPGPVLATMNGFSTTFHHGRFTVPKIVNRFEHQTDPRKI